MAIDLKTLIGKLERPARAALERAAQRCLRQTHFAVEIEHLLIELRPEMRRRPLASAQQPRIGKHKGIAKHNVNISGSAGRAVRYCAHFIGRLGSTEPLAAENRAPLTGGPVASRCKQY